MSLKLEDRFAVFSATGFYTGFIPGMPGTYGTLVALFFYWIFFAKLHVSQNFFVIFTGLFTLFSIWAADRAAKVFNQKDPGKIVIDEMAGYFTGVLFLPFTFKHALAAFVIFRVLDMTKPYPISWLDRRLTGGWGIVLDDIAAGVGTLIAMQGVMRVL